LKRRTLTIALAGMLALLGAVAVLAYARQANNRAVSGLRAETVLAATGAIPAGTSLETAQREHWLISEKVPEASLSTTPVHSVTAANAHMVVSATVAKGQLLLQNMLVSAASVVASGGFAIPPGMVAVAVQMCVSEVVANYITPGAYVAVFDTYAGGKGSQVQRTCSPSHEVTNSGSIVSPAIVATRIVLTRAEVLAVGESPGTQGTPAGSASTVANPTSSASSSQDSVLVTLAVNQADAERLILIDELGLPYMALLGPTSKTAFDNPVSASYLFRP
jgi:pilus assembly protein CpaB